MKTFRSSSDLRLPKGIAGIQIQVLRESPLPYGATTELSSGAPNYFPDASGPQQIAEFFRTFAGSDPEWDWERESLMVFLLNTRRRLAAWTKASVGTLDTLLVHPRDVFRVAIVANAAAVVIAHNHPSGDPAPSEADIRVTREFIRAGQLLKIELLDHVIVGNPAVPVGKGWASLRELGFFCV